MSSSFIEKARGYGAFHKNHINKLTHFIGIPLIIFSLMVLFSLIKISIPSVLSALSFSWLLLLALLSYYFLLEKKLTMIITPILVCLNFLAVILSDAFSTATGFKLFLTLFVLGWIFQLLGHVFERRRPALIDNFSQAFIAPLFLVAEACFYFGKRLDLYKAINAGDC